MIVDFCEAIGTTLETVKAATSHFEDDPLPVLDCRPICSLTPLPVKDEQLDLQRIKRFGKITPY